MLKKIISNPLSLIVVAIGLVASFLVCISSNTNGYVYESKTIKNKENTLCIMYETTVNSGVYEEQLGSSWPASGYIFNDEISGCKNGAELSWNQDNNQVIVKSDIKEQCYVYFDVLSAKHLSYSNPGSTECTDVECALDELYTLLVGEITIVYWNDNFRKNTYTKNQVPTGTALTGTYESIDSLITAYGSSNFEENPIYVKTALGGGSPINHKICALINNREFCVGPNYWDTDAATTLNKLKSNLENTLGITIPNNKCTTGEYNADCEAQGINFGSNSNGNMYFWASDYRCYIYSNGNVDCGA